MSETVAERPKMRPPFDPAILDTLRGCDEALAAVAHELRRLTDTGAAGTMPDRMTYLAGLKAEIKDIKRRLADTRDNGQLGIFVRHLKAVLVERFGPDAEAMMREAGERAARDMGRIDEARRLKLVGSAVPVLGVAGGTRQRKGA